MAKVFFMYNTTLERWRAGRFDSEGNVISEFSVKINEFMDVWRESDGVDLLTLRYSGRGSELLPLFENIPISDVASDKEGTPYANRAAFETATKDFFFRVGIDPNDTVLAYSKVEVDALIPCVTIKDAGSFTHTGNTVETTVLTKTLPGGVLGLFGAIEIICLASRSVFVNVTDLNIYINNQKVMGAPIAAGSKSLSTHLFLQNANSPTVQVGKPLGTTGATFGSTSTVVVETTINTAEDMTIDFKIKHTVGTDIAALRGTLIKLWK